MSALIAHLSAAERKRLLADINYLNLEEVGAFCKRHKIPMRIEYEIAGGKFKATRSNDRKKIVLERIRVYLKTGKVPPPTRYAKSIVRLEPLERPPTARDRLYYGRYDKKNPDMIALLKELTGGKFRNGATARIVLAEFWSRGEAPTYKEFARAWLAAGEDFLLVEHPEAAYLNDHARGDAGPEWKARRQRIARDVLKILSAIDPPSK
jgi:hypothetical protein